MELVTHALAGPLLGRAGLEKKLAAPDGSVRRATWLLITAALAPDLDNLIAVKGTAVYLDYHRGFTHSFAGGIVVAAIVAGCFWLPRPGPRYRDAYLLALAGVYSHLFLDLITSYGTQIFFPFSTHRYGLNLVFIIDPLFTLLFTLPFWWHRSERQRSARVALRAIALYLIICGGLNLTARGIARASLRSAGVTPGSTTAFPRLPALLSWFVIDVTPGAYQQTFWNLWNPLSVRTITYPRIVDDALLQEARRQPAVRSFLRFAKFPYMSVEEGPSGRVLRMFDLRFNTFPGTHRRPFEVEAFFDRDGQLTECRFVERETRLRD